MIVPNYINKVDPIKTQLTVDQWPLGGCWSALELGFGRDKVYVIVHGNGPTDNIHAVEKLLKSAVNIHESINK